MPGNGDDAEAAVACLGDGAALVSARADEEDARHGGMLVEGEVWNDRHGVGAEACAIRACCLVRLRSVGRRSVAQEVGAGHVPPG